MLHPIHVVLSVPPAGVSEDEYSSWYDTHVAEILAIPGFVAARRYWLAPGAPDRPPVEYRHAVVYVMDRPSQAPLDELARRAEAMTMPGWFGEIRCASFDGRPLEDEDVVPPAHGYLVLSHAPGRFTTEAYYGWYYAHARENLTSEGFDTVWRFALTPVAADPGRAGRATHAAFYAVRGELPVLREALADTARARRVDIPDWMAEGEFVSFDCVAAAPLQSAPTGR